MAEIKQMEKSGEEILGRAGVKPRFGGQNAMLCSDSLVGKTPQQVKDDRQGRGWSSILFSNQSQAQAVCRIPLSHRSLG